MCLPNVLILLSNWSEREDSNLRPLRPERRLFPPYPGRSRVLAFNHTATDGEQGGNRGERSRTEIAQPKPSYHPYNLMEV